jgi:hypothetical protein
MFRCLALPKAKFPAGTSLFIVEPAAIKAPSSSITGATNTLLEPTKTSLPILVLCLFTPS